jgi:hypothetical protein
MNFQDAPAWLGLHSHRDKREFRDDGKLIAGARDGKERTLCRPIRNGRTGWQSGYGESLAQQTEFKLTMRVGHCGLEQAPHQATVDGDGGAVHVAGALRSEKRDNRGKFPRSAQATRGDFTFPTGDDFLGLPPGACGDC